MDEPTLQQVIDGFRYGPLLGSIEDRAKGIASYLERSPKVRVALDRIEGTVAHFIQSTMIEDYETWRLNGRLGDPIQFVTSRFEIDMAPQNAG
ncbi:hypothetical protein [Paraburkholderia sp. RL18-085-BIA-A]|uniref:hypothetical protein n=1 Tax=Paraburkholderia sp. RL18-085-BIA-A TaxID=3031633 RepID=UPI0038B7C013